MTLEEGLRSLGFDGLRKIEGGWQSLAVYAATVDGGRVAVKVLDPRRVDRRLLDLRLEAVSSLSRASDMVCGPVAVGGCLVNEIAADRAQPVYVVAHELADGGSPDVGEPEDAARMGRMLAELHALMAELPPYDLPGLTAFPPLSALGKVADDLDVPLSRLADPDQAQRFRDRFLGGYRDRSGVVPDHAMLDKLIMRRVLALAVWLEDPTTAPPGVRGASDEWRGTLRSFVRAYFTV